MKLENGIIPACAGSTRDRTCAHTACGDHPRVRGEHLAMLVSVPYSGGSSPRARGARRMALCGVATSGIIPACAGSTSAARGRPPRPWDHPRVRGEH